MNDSSNQENLPAQIASAVASVPKAWIPNSVKVIDQLVGSVAGIPLAWLNQQKVKIESQTQSYITVEKMIGDSAAKMAIKDTDTVQNAIDNLVRKSYRSHSNKKSVVFAMFDSIKAASKQKSCVVSSPDKVEDIDDDWLNVFERYAEDASTERMQNLWGRVLSGEIRKPGKYSLRTLRFLSELSQSDATSFAEFCCFAFKDFSPTSLTKPDDKKDIRNLIYLESAGLIQGVSGMGLVSTQKFNDKGALFITEGDTIITLISEPNTEFQCSVLALTPLGQELLSLVPERDTNAAAKKVAYAMRNANIKFAAVSVFSIEEQKIISSEVLWQDEEI